jgi:nucleoside-diphosphate-sugar epimerase
MDGQDVYSPVTAATPCRREKLEGQWIPNAHWLEWRRGYAQLQDLSMDEVVLLTGLPSLYARRLAQELRQTGAEVVALVRRSERYEGVSKVLEGSASALDLGLSGSELMELAERVTHVHHVAEVSPVEGNEPASVAAAREILEFALHCKRLRCLVHHSTLRVAGDRTGLVREDDLERGQRFRNKDDEGRARAEKLLRGARTRLPVVVLRPAPLVGDSETGELDTTDVALLLRLLVVSPRDLSLPLLGRGQWPLHVVPVDYVARAACLLGRHKNAPGRTFHLVDSVPLPARQWVERVVEAAQRDRPVLPAYGVKAVLDSPGLERLLRSPRAFFDDLLAPVGFSTAHADELLASSGLRCPPFESYVERLVAWVVKDLRGGN